MGGRRKRRRKKEPSDKSLDNPQDVQLKRIANLLALLAIKGQQQKEQIITLDAVGYSRDEIAQMLVTTPPTISQTLYAHRAGREKARRRKTPGGRQGGKDQSRTA